jgi:antitoxin (DNA-binding transcriptional repressor) of toxin-antitoxin stability system
MSTITTKQLRENMSQVIHDLRQGRSIQLSYRHSVIGVLQPIQVAKQTLRRGSPESIRQGLDSLRNLSVPSIVSKDTRSIKEQIAELRTGKYLNK